MAEVIVIHKGAEVFRYAPDAEGQAPIAVAMRSAVTHALACAIAALAELPQQASPPDRHAKMLRDIADRMIALDHPYGATVLQELSEATDAHIAAVDRAVAFIEEFEEAWRPRPN